MSTHVRTTINSICDCTCDFDNYRIVQKPHQDVHADEYNQTRSTLWSESSST